MIYEGCQGKAKEGKFIDKRCPNCGSEVEMFTTDTEVNCPECGCTVYNDTLNCVRWCEHAKECVGEELYEILMKKAGIHEQKKPDKAVKFFGF